MPKIDKIQAAKKTKARYHIHLEEEGRAEYSFSVSEDILIQEDLFKGKELTKEDIDRLRHSDELDKAYQRALNYLSYRMRSEKEVAVYLKEQEVPEEEISHMIEKLRRLDFINDQRFADAFVRTKRDQSKKGPNIIRQELKQKGVEENIMNKSLDQYTPEEQLDLAIELAEKKQRSYKKESTRQKEQKLVQFLVQKGFSHSVAAEALKEADIDNDEDEQQEAISGWGEKSWRKFESEAPYKRRQKIKQALYRRGFPGDLIDQWIDEKEMEEE
ncbi:recombination regulator RecX [Alkalicoccus daliensis]|uniref:Regulatory protein RecX n=1 Tax=Alkalicoccus daliensis TaxID=745820 RepID=A0A1H0DNB2_9BACI|nr:recombination regulator RecX [Alkalicoccus daliensis]SDN71642.1 regulatory protein [Alkalicoccus daliensis]